MKILPEIRTIRGKITWFIVGISIALVLISSSIEVISSINMLKREIIKNILIDAKLLAEYSAMPLEFQYPERAYELLDQLETNSNILAGVVYNSEGDLFAQYNQIPVKEHIEIMAKETDYYFVGDVLHVFEPIIYKNQFYGVLYLQVLTNLTGILIRRLGITLLIIIFISVLGYIFTKVMHTRITNPLVQMAEVARNVAQTNDLSQRIVKLNNDEFGELTDNFNVMLERLQYRELERDGAINALQESESKLSAFITNSDTVIFMKDLHGRYLLANKQMCEMLELEEKQILGKTDFILFQDTVALKLEESDKRVINERKPVQVEESIPVNDFQSRTYLTTKFPLFTTSGALYGLGGISTNISSRKKTELELQKYKNQLEDLVKIRTSKIEEINKELTIANRNLQKQKVELENTLAELKDAQNQLLQSEKLASIGLLTAGIAHEINNPVNFINSNITGLKTLYQDLNQYLKKLDEISEALGGEYFEEIEKSKAATDYVYVKNSLHQVIENIEKGVERTTQIIKGLRTFSRMDNDNLIHFSLHESIDSTLILLYHQYKNRISIIKDYNAEIPLFYGNPGKINQMFMNLLSNAIDAIADKGMITIRTRLIENFVHINIEDTGAGIQEKELSKIFEPFFTTKEIGKGTGLGLSITYGIIKEHHGDIKVHSHPGEGTKFSIKIPLR